MPRRPRSLRQRVCQLAVEAGGLAVLVAAVASVSRLAAALLVAVLLLAVGTLWERVL